ncbi:MAG: TM2 domain-containing protein [Oscillospiraceae bacterium]|nr:TM2 domain-containing protein [Oscillospiraceae bacterium]
MSENSQVSRVSSKSKGVAAVLCFFFGVLGIHRFYVGKAGTGVVWFITAGLLGIGAFVDFIMIICGSFKDSYGLELK